MFPRWKEIYSGLWSLQQVLGSNPSGIFSENLLYETLRRYLDLIPEQSYLTPFWSNLLPTIPTEMAAQPVFNTDLAILWRYLTSCSLGLDQYLMTIEEGRRLRATIYLFIVQFIRPSKWTRPQAASLETDSQYIWCCLAWAFLIKPWMFFFTPEGTFILTEPPSDMNEGGSFVISWLQWIQQRHNIMTV